VYGFVSDYPLVMHSSISQCLSLLWPPLSLRRREGHAKSRDQQSSKCYIVSMTALDSTDDEQAKSRKFSLRTRENQINRESLYSRNFYCLGYDLCVCAWWHNIVRLEAKDASTPPRHSSQQQPNLPEIYKIFDNHSIDYW